MIAASLCPSRSRATSTPASVARLFALALAARTVRLVVMVCWQWLGWHSVVAQTVDTGFAG
ncbi:MAG: hypothetical protein CMH36_02395 [Microbacterium sp.]|uniref:Uncharacterized protein n=1 Tax=Microbacterium ginsengisoli TaxID=400772 RepID=A0A3C1KE53_9MICO|nr:DUF6186 family protein [Microbacterium bovistercoris]MAL05678.1 hypothetical protein [Microbacterium sp.]MBN9208018.1 hypothetical protein [Microbacterium ginsengisoli]HAN24935.1 hypothetical protein [Microbacterium ginsengisoli]